MSVEDGLVMTLHPGVYRNHHEPTHQRFGADVGCDIPVAMEFTRGLQPLLERYGTAAGFHLVLFTLDETVFSREIAPLAGFYPSVYAGAPWWFLDAPEAIRRYRGAVTETAGFGRTSGFIDDTRAFCSIPARHDMSRRLDCGYLAELVATHRLDEDEALATRTTWWPPTRRRRSSCDPDTLRRLSRERDGRPAAPVRIAHLGPGNFFRAHQAWYTEHAPDAADWGIAAFAGRRGAVARELAAQDGLYTLLVRAADGDRPEVVSAVAEVSGRAGRLAALLRPPGAGPGHHHRHRGRLPARRRRRPRPGRSRGRRRHRRAARARHGRRGGDRPRQARPRAGRAAAPTACPGWPWCPATTSRTTGRWSRGWSASWPRPSTLGWPTGSPSTSRS